MYLLTYLLTKCGLTPKSNSFFHGPCATFPPNFVNIVNPANKQTSVKTLPPNYKLPVLST